MSQKTEWNLNLLLEEFNEKVIEKNKLEIKKEADNFIRTWKNDFSYMNNPLKLKEALEEYEQFLSNFSGGGVIGYYLFLRQSLNQSDNEIKAKLNSIEEFSKKISNEMRFFELNISKMSSEMQKNALSDTSLLEYKHYLERLFEMAKHILSEKEENILSLKETTSYSNWVRMVEDFLSREEKEVINDEGIKEKRTYEGILSLLRSKNKLVRDQAANAFNQILADNVDIAENEINSILMNKKIDDELRGFNRADQSRLLEDDIELDVVDSLLECVESKMDISKRYYALKSKILGVDKLKYYERSAPIGEIDETYPYEKAVALVKKTFSSLDKEFEEMFEKYLQNGQIDVFPKKGKSGGAFCIGWSVNYPTFILLNHDNKLREVTTIAHEVGHGFNNEFMKKKQNAINFGTPKSTAEAASTFMEDFVLEEIIKEADEETKLGIIFEKLDNDVSTIFRQVALYLFELELHKSFRERGYLSKQEIGELFVKNMSKYLGDAVDLTESQNWWVYWSHIRKFFYVYSYASGLLISKSMQSKVRKDKKFISNVKEFLSAGTSESPKEIFLKLGIDITNKSFWNEGLDEVEELLIEAENIAKKLGKL